MSDGGTILIVNGGPENSHRYLFESIARRYQIWLLHSEPPTWQRDLVAGTTVVEPLDGVFQVPDIDRMTAAGRAVAAERDIVGVLTFSEYNVVAAARIAGSLGLPGMALPAAENCRDKHRTRQLLTAAGLAQPRFAHVRDLATAAVAAADIGYPVVLKPRGVGASVGVVRVDNAGQLATGAKIAAMWTGLYNRSYAEGILVEELLDGPEISVDGVSYDGEYRPFIIARKRVGMAPYYVELSHRVSTDDPLYADRGLLHMLSAAHRALGVRHGMTHTEVKLTGRGPVIVEVNARLGGDMIPYLNKLASGVDAAETMADLAVGIRPTINPSARGCVGIRYICAPTEGVLRGVRLCAPGEAPGLIASAALIPAGATIRLPPRFYDPRYAYVICGGDSPQACDAALDAASARVSATLDPLPVEVPAPAGTR
jgi:biotin carboxylase